MSGQLVWLAILTLAVWAMVGAIVWAMYWTRKWVEADWEKNLEELRRQPP